MPNTKFFKFIFIFSFFFWNYSFSFAQKNEGTMNDQNFEKKYLEVLKTASKQDFFSVKFKQEIYSSLREKISPSDGILYIKKPASFRFEIISPRQEIYVSNSKNFWKYIPELKHAQSLQANANELAFVQLLTNLANIKKFYNVSVWEKPDAQKINENINTPYVKSDTPPPQNDDDIHLRLIPKEDKQQKVLYAVIQVKTGLIQELRIVQTNGNRTRLLFNDYSSNKFSDEVFEFKPPQGIVVDKL
ncbi:outer membrane lipoprotein carrier protein LolA [Pigmentibacter sp. JX0631]|uniref:LolA family protein n=1 Tax=Pigmentibacter sp. JX0631 TaxID=2976982 RepID=UPI002468C936|nr:outer membrane lipoprotein carrier protein LolA [Pigmentibacter sp. JX0631]WGL60577.1 outer membrane lipoprotein carrier protein LolA [Pigmentibacter sp. JX0631]